MFDEDAREEVRSQLKMVYEIMGSEEFTDSVSNYLWSMYSKLIKKGFTEEQATRIVSRMSGVKGN